MSEHIESLADRLSEAFGEPTAIPLDVKALLWEIDAEAWERGVMWKGGIGTVKPERPPNPYLEPPLDLPTEPTWGIAVTDRDTTHAADKTYLGKWCAEEGGTNGWFADRFFQGGHLLALDSVVDFIPLTDEQVARIEAGR